jgi:hypothetical protein
VISFIFLSTFTSADELTNSLANTYESGSIPNFLPQVGKALAGRCYLTTGSNKKIASVLMVSFEEDGYDIAPFDLDKTREDFFDQMSYEEVLIKFPIIKKMYLEVIETANGAIVENEVGDDAFKGEIRETEKYFIMRVFKNEKIIKYCNYKK